MSGAAPLSKELTEQFVRLLPNSNIFQAYGMTETATAVTMGPLNQKVATYGSAGQLMPGVVARVLKQDGSYGSVGEEGELLVKSPSNALRYSNNEAATKETFVDG
jgi:long-subunit acyl-CoA synthetase (AMP-forming)